MILQGKKNRSTCMLLPACAKNFQEDLTNNFFPETRCAVQIFENGD
jgi:hypothetical protein